MTLKDKVTSVVTGDAYDKPAKTKDGAMTTQGSSDAHTLEGTSADPNAPPTEESETIKKIGAMANKPNEMAQKAQEKAQNSSTGQKAMDKAQNTEQGQKALGKAEETADQAKGEAQASDANASQTRTAEKVGNFAKDKAQEGQGK